MTSKGILLAGVLAVSAFGCSTDVDPPGADTWVYPDFCPVRRLICAEDTICMGGTACRPAFDRDYELRLYLFAPTSIDKCGEDRDCPVPPVTIYYSETDSPILESADPRVAEVEVIEGSSLVIEIQNDDCVIPLTADRLRSGSVACTRGGMTATVMLEPMPHASD